MRLPNFVIIGAPKCGTTSLHRYLSQHPDIYLPQQKELHYFSYRWNAKFASGPGDVAVLQRMTKTLHDYKAHYTAVDGQSAIGEISPSYLYFSEVAGDIKKLLGGVKIVAVVRDPIQKAYSQYLHLVRGNREKLPFYDALLAEEQRRKEGWSDLWRYAESSLYSDRIRKYVDEFGASNVKVIVFEEFISNTRVALNRIGHFLGVRDEFEYEASVVHHRSGKAKSRTLARVLSKNGPLSKAARSLLPRPLTDAVQRRIWALITAKKDPIDARSIEFLKEYFESDVRSLETFLGRPLPWLGKAQPIGEQEHVAK